MYQIKINGILMPTIYWTLGEAMRACDYEKDRAPGSVSVDIVRV